MANPNDPNQLGKPATLSKLEELGRRFSNRMMGTSAQEEKLIERLSELDYQLSQTRPAPNQSAQELAQNIANIHTQRSQIESRLKTIEGIRSSVAARLYGSGVETALRRSNVSRDVNALAGSSAIMGQAAAGISRSTISLEQQHQESLAAIISKSAEIREAVKNNPTNRRGIESLGQELSSSISSAAVARGALDLQKRAGLDVKSRYLTSGDIFNRLQNEISQSDLANNVAAGRAGTKSQQEAVLRESLGQIGMLRNQQANESDPKKFEDLQKAIDNLTASARGASDTLREMKRQGGGGGRFGMFMQAAGMAAGTGANLVDTWSYENPMRQRQNEIRYAELGNRQFTDMQNALGGDMGALRRLGSSYEAASGLNIRTKGWSRAGTALTATQGLIGNIAQGASSGGIGRFGAVLGGINNVSSAAANWNQQAGERGSALAALDIERADARNFIQDQLAQSYVNYAKGLGGASMGMGGLRGALVEQMIKPDTIRRLAGQGINTERATELTRMAVGALGRQFTNVDAIENAGKVERGGYMSAEQYFQSLGRMSNTSGNAGNQFQEILKNAVAAGLDSAKNIQQMVDATVTLSERTARMGIDSSGAAADILGKAVQSMGGTPANMQVGAAMSAIDFANAAASNKGLDFSTIAEQGGISKAFRKASLVQREVLAGLTATQLQQLTGPGGAEAAEKYGLGSLAQNIGSAKFQDELEKLKREKILNRFAPPGKIPGDIRQQIMDASDLSKLGGEAGEVWRGLATIADVSGEGLGGILRKGGPTKGTVGTEATGPEVRAADEVLKAQAEGQRRILEEGRNIVGSLSNVAGVLREVATAFNPEKMSSAVQTGAEKFNVPVQDFSIAVKEFARVVDGMGKSRK